MFRRTTWILLTGTLLTMMNVYSQDMPPSATIVNKGVTLSYDRKGAGDTAMIFVHGWCINKSYWIAQTAHFSNRFITVAPDLHGHGASGRNRNDWTIATYASDVVALIEQLKFEKVILVGHSMGGNIILEVADRIPDKVVGFIGVDNLLDEIPAPGPEEQKNLDAFFSQLENSFDATLSAYTRAALFPPNYPDSVSLNRVVNDYLQADSTIAIATLRSLMAVTPRESELIGRLRVTLHLIVSDMNKVNEDRLIKRCRKGYSIETIKGVGHFPMMEKPAEFNAALERILARL
jgi:pimeloyl-ACP methyl ester carboxylesterase